MLSCGTCEQFVHVKNITSEQNVACTNLFRTIERHIVNRVGHIVRADYKGLRDSYPGRHHATCLGR